MPTINPNDTARNAAEPKRLEDQINQINSNEANGPKARGKSASSSPRTKPRPRRNK